MSPNDIKRIVNCVVDYGWPWQWLTDEGFETPSDQSLNALLWQITKYHVVRLDPNHPHDWPIETREGMPCWALIFEDHKPRWRRFRDRSEVFERKAFLRSANDEGLETIVDNIEDLITAPHPLNPTMEPPADWVADGRRILK
jgi:hypothetical protein